MKFKTFINEMTMKAGSYEHLESHLSAFEKVKEEGVHCGDIEHYNVYRRERSSILIDYAIFLQDKIIAFFVIDSGELSTAFVSKSERKKGLFSAFLFFLKRNEGMNEIILVDLHNEDTINAIKRIYKRFKTSWVKGDEKVDFDPTIEKPYYLLMKPTGWKIMLENDGDFSNYLKFFNEETALAEGKLLEIYYFGPYVDPEL